MRYGGRQKRGLRQSRPRSRMSSAMHWSTTSKTSTTKTTKGPVMTTLIEWGYRQGSVVTLADNERDAATRVEILASLGHVAEVVHRRVILEEGVDMVNEFRQNWLDGGDRKSTRLNSSH